MDGIVTRGNLTPAQTTFLDRLLEELHKQGTLEEQALFQEINRLTWKPQKYPSDSGGAEPTEGSRGMLL